MSPLELIIGSFVTWRVSNILIRENGPLAIFARLRAYLAENQHGIGGLYDLFSCISCLSIYIGAVTALALAGDTLEWILYSLSFSAITVIIERLMSKKDNI